MWYLQIFVYSTFLRLGAGTTGRLGMVGRQLMNYSNLERDLTVSSNNRLVEMEGFDASAGSSLHYCQGNPLFANIGLKISHLFQKNSYLLHLFWKTSRLSHLLQIVLNWEFCPFSLLKVVPAISFEGAEA